MNKPASSCTYGYDKCEEEDGLIKPVDLATKGNGHWTTDRNWTMAPEGWDNSFCPIPPSSWSADEPRVADWAGSRPEVANTGASRVFGSFDLMLHVTRLNKLTKLTLAVAPAPQAISVTRLELMY